MPIFLQPLCAAMITSRSAEDDPNLEVPLLSPWRDSFSTATCLQLRRFMKTCQKKFDETISTQTNQVIFDSFFSKKGKSGCNLRVHFISLKK